MENVRTRQRPTCHREYREKNVLLTHKKKVRCRLENAAVIEDNRFRFNEKKGENRFRRY